MKNNNFRNAFFSAFGSIICICFIAYLDKYFENTIWLIPPFGATMVLVMAVHESPLAQPKNIILGHIFSALSGVIIYYLLGDTFFSIGIAVGLAVFIMMITSTTHPPAGANPIIVILTEQGLNFVLFPVAVCATIIVFFAIIYNKTLKRKYPY